MGVAVQAERLLQMAKARTPEDRMRLLMAITDLCDSAGNAGVLESGAVKTLLEDIFLNLVSQAEHDVRMHLAEKLAPATWAPRALIQELARDEIDIARPVIAMSPILQDQDLIRLLVEATIDHQIEVARRPNLDALVVDAIVSQGEPSVVTALAANDTADVSPVAMERLVDQSRYVASLRAPLARHAKLTSELAHRLYAWVGQVLRAELVARFQVDETALDAAVIEAVDDAFRNPFAAAALPGEDIRSHEDREEMERRLIAKLHDAGDLRPSYLLRALREGKVSLFEAALARLGNFTSEQIHTAISCDRPELLALACTAVGVDRSVFPTILTLVRRLNDGKPEGPAEPIQRALGAFGEHPQSAAGSAFRHAVSMV